MIKVIEHGRKQFQMVCVKCDCKFEYELSDLLETYDKIGFVICPDCGFKCAHRYGLGSAAFWNVANADLKG